MSRMTLKIGLFITSFCALLVFVFHELSKPSLEMQGEYFRHTGTLAALTLAMRASNKLSPNQEMSLQSLEQNDFIQQGLTKELLDGGSAVTMLTGESTQTGLLIVHNERQDPHYCQWLSDKGASEVLAPDSSVQSCINGTLTLQVMF